mgnify:CR=1 FL=1
MTDRQLTELGFYVLPGHTESPADAITEAQALAALPPHWAQAARTLGASPWRVFVRVTLPLVALLIVGVVRHADGVVAQFLLGLSAGHRADAAKVASIGVKLVRLLGTLEAEAQALGNQPIDPSCWEAPLADGSVASMATGPPRRPPCPPACWRR